MPDDKYPRSGASRTPPFGRKVRRWENRIAVKDRKPPPGERHDGLALVYGIHSVREALANPRRVPVRLIATENGALRLREDGPLALEPVIVKPDDIGRQLTPDAVHQGVLLLSEPLEPIGLEDLADDALVLALDQVTDPHNVGAILRTAAAFGVAALITTERHSPEVTGVMAKAASGGLEHVPFCVVKNLGNALQALGERGFQCVGFDSEGAEPIGHLAMQRPLVLVLGAEGKGLRARTREVCQTVVRLEMPGAIKSLNVSNAAAIALYAVTAAFAGS
jgi:23S rRNA (guanosine2251-2'-O)-methyltransferase